MISFVCDKCGNTSFIFVVLTEEEIEEKIKNLNYKNRLIPKKVYIKALFVGYHYVQCLNCNWGKFVKNAEAKHLEDLALKDLEERGLIKKV